MMDNHTSTHLRHGTVMKAIVAGAAAMVFVAF